MKIGHLETEIEELKKKLEEKNLEVDPQVKTQIENSIRIEERDKSEHEIKELNRQQALLLNENAHFQKMYEEKKEENARLLESDSEKTNLADLLPKNEIGKKHLPLKNRTSFTLTILVSQERPIFSTYF